MTFRAKILADSINDHKSRLTTVELTYPRVIHSEFMTHRLFSRNAASSRAIPIERMIANVLEDPFIPFEWGRNQGGMQAGDQIGEIERREAVKDHLAGFNAAVAVARKQHKRGLHKQIVNRYLEPWMWITVIASGTDAAFRNFFHLRCHPDAEPHIHIIADMLREIYTAGCPEYLPAGEWHLPLVSASDYAEPLTTEELIKVSVGRCARVSYLTHDGKRDPSADIGLHDRLAKSGHWSPFEHVAQSLCTDADSGNFQRGWAQYRKEFRNECA